MTDKEFVSYLANLIMISKADGSISEEEQAAIAWVYEEINANETDFEEAKRITEKDGYQVTAVGRYSERIRNLEDMIFVALSDNALSDPEKILMRSFAKAIGAKQEQIDTILSEAIARFRAYRATITCSNCGYEIPAAWRFCSECGTGTQAQTV
ncbi:MAG: zinc-ribbon domain-containing protein [Deltaproteobacteria bacterium]|nr:MAG: zinc-ribbon domain-containing protein [Deltaproteobacteria bacterium]